MPYAEHTIPDADERNAFFDAMDEMAGTGEFDLLPKDWYEFTVGLKEFKISSKGACMARLEFTVTNDNDGFNGRKVWVNAMLEGTDKDGRSQTWFLAKLIKGLIAQYGRESAMNFVPFPGWQPDVKMCIVPRSMDGTPDYTEWQAWFDMLLTYTILARVDHKPKRVKQPNGEYVKSATEKEADVVEFKSADKTE